MKYRIVEKNNGKFNIQYREWMLCFPSWSDYYERQYDNYSHYPSSRLVDYDTFDEAKAKIDRLLQAKVDKENAINAKKIKKIHPLKKEVIR
jgi:hypothetical protein